MSDLVGNPYERFSRDAAQIIVKPLNVLLLKMFYYSIVSSHRAEQLSRIIKWLAPKVENLLTPAQIDSFVIHNTSFVTCTKIYKNKSIGKILENFGKFLIADSICHR